MRIALLTGKWRLSSRRVFRLVVSAIVHTALLKHLVRSLSRTWRTELCRLLCHTWSSSRVLHSLYFAGYAAVFLKYALPRLHVATACLGLTKGSKLLHRDDRCGAILWSACTLKRRKCVSPWPDPILHRYCLHQCVIDIKVIHLTPYSVCTWSTSGAWSGFWVSLMAKPWPKRCLIWGYIILLRIPMSKDAQGYSIDPSSLSNLRRSLLQAHSDPNLRTSHESKSQYLSASKAQSWRRLLLQRSSPVLYFSCSPPLLLLLSRKPLLSQTLFLISLKLVPMDHVMTNGAVNVSDAAWEFLTRANQDYD